MGLRQEDIIVNAVEKVVFENYGPEGDSEVYANAEDLLDGGHNVSPDAEMLLMSALELEHLDADGILAMMRGAVRHALEEVA
ncbi:hypothetical protein SEA_BIG4_342 [Microbacterium phage Big4]|nr:hypothetical protein SEA_BIG4_16 [Microbacterium phage Big4]URP22375.1 hypothetical protein SEA_BIG4_342 [Microbacterium phage Big4]